jgi:ERCC4-related helicase
LGYFTAGIRLAYIRDDLIKHGIGVVRSKLHRLRNERPSGPLATIVKSKEFQALWELVEEASCNPNATANSTREKVKNNPKLEKLNEILTEHFERARACNTSSRAIVFSAFRGSVSEIVQLLDDSKPLIRARQFVGQGKGSSKISEKEGDAQCEGMKQSEQKAVLEQFKMGEHNTLVCTSIGEEGCTY